MRQTGYILLMISLFSFTAPIWGDMMVQQNMGMGFSTRDSGVSLQSGGYATFEVGRIYNTGDQIMRINGEWRTTDGTLMNNKLVAVEFVENGYLLSPGDSMVVHARAVSPSTDGTLNGVVEIQTANVDAVDLGTSGISVGGQVLPGKEVSFALTFSAANSGAGTDIPLNDQLGGVSAILGAVAIAVDEKRKK